MKQSKSIDRIANHVLYGALAASIIMILITYLNQPFETRTNNYTSRGELENYYNVEYEMQSQKATITINKPCVEIATSYGTSMQPFFEDQNIIIIDTCFPKEELKVNDIILFNHDFDDHRTQHRITKINYQDEWVKTKGDANNKEDDITGFDHIYGKTIGVLNVLTRKKAKENTNQGWQLNETQGVMVMNSSTLIEQMNLTTVTKIKYHLAIDCDILIEIYHNLSIMDITGSTAGLVIQCLQFTHEQLTALNQQLKYAKTRIIKNHNCYGECAG